MDVELDCLDAVDFTDVDLQDWKFDLPVKGNPTDELVQELAKEKIAESSEKSASSKQKRLFMEEEKNKNILNAEIIHKETAGPASKTKNVAQECLNLGLARCDLYDAKMHQISNIVEGINAQSKKIVTLQQKLARLPAGQTTLPLTDELKAAFEVLKECDCDLLPEGAKELSPEMLHNIKTALDQKKTQWNTEIQKNFMNIQQITQQYNSILDSLKIILRHYSNLISTIEQHMSR